MKASGCRYREGKEDERVKSQSEEETLVWRVKASGCRYRKGQEDERVKSKSGERDISLAD